MTALAAEARGDRRLRLDGDGWAVEITASEFNRRLQVLSYHGTDLIEMAAALDELARDLGYGKIFLKARPLDRPQLEAAGMEAEATIWGYFDGEDAVVMSRFVDPGRRRRPFFDEQARIVDAVTARPPDPAPRQLPDGYHEATAAPDDARELAELYREVFASYPFPITDPDYLVATMRSHVVYRIVRDLSGDLVAAASAETDGELRHAEMTDFATLASERGLGLALRLLDGLEREMTARGILNLYSIARAHSFGMNRVFFNRGYELTGTLVANCHISGRFEDMHVWCREAVKSRRAGSQTRRQ